MPTAVIAFNDRAALGIMESLRATGMNVPEDVSVLGYDDSQFARLSYVGLSSISQDAPLLAAAAVDRAAFRGTPGGIRRRLRSLRANIRFTGRRPSRKAP